MGNDSVNPEPGRGGNEKPVLQYGQERPEPIAGNIATGCVMALFFFLPIYMAATSGGMGAPGHAGVFLLCRVDLHGSALFGSPAP